MGGKVPRHQLAPRGAHYSTPPLTITLRVPCSFAVPVGDPSSSSGDDSNNSGHGSNGDNEGSGGLAPQHGMGTEQMTVAATEAFVSPDGLIGQKKQEIYDLTQGNMSVAEYLNCFTYLSRYSHEEVNTDAKKQYLFHHGLQNEIQLQLLNTDYANFQKLVDEVISLKASKRR
jgi:hypothetical protein